MGHKGRHSRGVLLVEDDPGLLAVLAYAFRAAGFFVRTARDEQEALREFEVCAPAAVVTDLILPDGEGMGTIQAMKAAAPNAPLVVMSGGGFFSAGHLMTMACAMGADATLSKPFHPREAVALVSRLLSPPLAELAA